MREIGISRRGERTPQVAEHPLERLVEPDLQLIEVGVQRRLERGVGVEPLAVGAKQLVDARLAERGDHVLDEQRRLEVGERNRARILERRVQILQLERLAVFEHQRELHVHLAPPLGARALFLVHGDALGEPPRHALLRHLQRDDVRELVPERGLPLELARPRFRRIHRHDPAEAGAERADHAGQTGVAHGEVVVLRKDLDENRTLRRELVPRRKCLERLMRERNGVLLQHRRFLLVHAHDEIAVADRLELVEHVEHVQQVLGDGVERVGLERCLERGARRGLVAGAQQVQAEIRLASADSPDRA